MNGCFLDLSVFDWGLPVPRLGGHSIRLTKYVMNAPLYLVRPFLVTWRGTLVKVEIPIIPYIQARKPEANDDRS